MEIYLNLLPKEKKEEIKRKKISRLIIGQEIAFLFIVIIFIFILFGINSILYFQSQAIFSGDLNGESKKYNNMQKFEQLFAETNKKIFFIDSLQKNHINWMNFFLNFNDVVPEGVIISEIANDDYKVFVSGKVKNRDILLNFKKDIVKKKCFSDVNIPLSNIVVKEDIDFQIDFNVNKECLNE